MKDDRVLLNHIRDAAQRVLDYTRDGRDAFRMDTKTQDAVVRNLQIVGEAAKRLSDGLRAAHGAVAVRGGVWRPLPMGPPPPGGPKPCGTKPLLLPSS